MKKIMFVLLAGLAAWALVLTGCPTPDDTGGKTVTGIVVNTTKTEYNINEDLAIVVTATFSDGSTQAVTGYTTSGYDKTKTGNQTVTVSYQGKTAGFTVTVIDPSKPSAVKPTASPAAGAAASGSSVTLTTTTEGAEIWYTINGSTPAKNGAGSTKYTTAFTITPPVTVKAVAVKEGMNDSAVLEAAYAVLSDPSKPTAARPAASPAAGEVASNTSVTLSTTTQDAEIWYTINGSTPAKNGAGSTKYTTAFTITPPVTVKAIAVKEGMNDSAVLEAAYAVLLPSFIPQGTILTALTESAWADGNIIATGYEQWYRFTATASTQYIHVNYDTLKWLFVQVYDSSGTAVGDEHYFASNVDVRNISRSVTVGKEYYIKVRSHNSFTDNYSGTYQIGFNARIIPPGSDVIQLTENVWADGNLPTENSEQWFKFTATASTQYIHGNFLFGTLTNMYVQLYDSSGATVGSRTLLYNSTKNVSQAVAVGQEYYIKVQYYSNSGTYQITFNASATPPALTMPSGAIQLTANTWADGNLPTQNDVQWFKFTATASTQYIHGNFGTLTYLYVQMYDSSGTAVGSQTYLYSSSSSISPTVTAGQEYYIRVWPSGSNGTYKIMFNTIPSAQGSSLASKLSWLKSNAQSDTEYLVIVDKAETLNGTNGTSSSFNYLYYDGKTNVTIRLTGDQTVSLSSDDPLFRIGSGVTLILDQITLIGNDCSEPLVWVYSGGKLEMGTGSKITGNRASFTSSAFDTNANVYGGGVYVVGTFTMNGGEISGNTVSANTIYTANPATANAYGGGVYVVGTFTMSGGKISGNSTTASTTKGNANAYGGGVYVKGTFTMSGGEISGNTASATSTGSNAYASGGGVYVESGTFTKSGGTITGYADDTTNGNVVKKAGVVQSNQGHAVYKEYMSSIIPARSRETTAGPSINIDSNQAGAAGGWEN